jgi:hypothetical protein
VQLVASPCAQVCNLCPFPARTSAECLLSVDTMLSRLEMGPQRIQSISHLNGHYPVSRDYCAFPQLYALQSSAHGEVISSAITRHQLRYLYGVLLKMVRTQPPTETPWTWMDNQSTQSTWDMERFNILSHLRCAVCAALF